MSRIRPALHDLDHRTLDRLTRVHDLFDAAPRALVLRALLRQDQAALFVFLLQHEGLDVVADLHDLVRVDVVADRELLARDHALALVADVEQHLVAVDLDDVALDDVAVAEVVERRLERLDQLLGRVVLAVGGVGRAEGGVDRLPRWCAAARARPRAPPARARWWCCQRLQPPRWRPQGPLRSRSPRGRPSSRHSSWSVSFRRAGLTTRGLGLCEWHASVPRAVHSVGVRRKPRQTTISGRRAPRRTSSCPSRRRPAAAPRGRRRAPCVPARARRPARRWPRAPRRRARRAR